MEFDIRHVYTLANCCNGEEYHCDFLDIPEETIMIKVNEQDTSYPDSLEVRCGKLKSVIPYALHKRFAEEAVKIFDLLEKAEHESSQS